MKDKPVILIVDDQPQDIELLEAYLVPQGYEIVKASSGEKALEKLSSNQIELILMDVLMSGLDGFEVTRRIRRDTAHRLIPIILITALQETEDRVKGIEAGCDDFLSKPLDKMELFARVRSLLQVKAYNDLMSNYQIELEAMVTSRTEELRHTLEKLQQEITERKRVEEELKSNYALLQIGGETAIFGGWSVDLENNICTWSDTVAVIHDVPHGYAPPVQEVINFYAPEWQEKITQLFSACAKEGIPYDEEMEIKTQKGKRVWVRTTGRAVRNEKDKIIKVQGSFQDISAIKKAETEKEKLQTQLRHAQKMESVGQLAGGVAHDFNNMLGVIIGHTEMALEQIDPGQPLFDDLQEILKAAKRSADLTSQLLTFARKQIVAPKVIDLNETVESMLNMLRRLIGEDIDVVWRPGKKLAPVKMDPTQIDLILANLCVNARDAIAGVGKLTIETDRVCFDEEYCADHAGFIPGEFIMIAVSDNGCGMHPETVSHLFEPFFTTKEVGKGTGLGLASVYGAVKQNNGFINVYSEPGQGTTFKIYLPRHQATTPVQTDTAPAKPTARGKETILLVEDEPAILRIATRMLERQGYVVIAANTPGEAIRLAHENAGEIHMLMTDVVMPEMNGRDLAKNLLSICPGIKRLFMSGYTANVIAHHGVLDEGVYFIQKPFSSKDLGTKLREVLEDTTAD